MSTPNWCISRLRHRRGSQYVRADPDRAMWFPRWPAVSTDILLRLNSATAPSLTSKIVNVGHRHAHVVFWIDMMLALDDARDLRPFVVEPFDERITARPLPSPFRTQSDTGTHQVDQEVGHLRFRRHRQ